MQYKKMTGDQKAIKHWRAKRNLLLKKILDADKMITRQEAMQRANKQAGPMPGNRTEGT
jgi:hypothetical protein